MNNLKISKFSAKQVENIIDKVVPIIAKPEDYEFFRGVLYCLAEDVNSASFSATIAKLLKNKESEAL